MPLASRINHADSEPKTKRTKMSKQKSASNAAKLSAKKSASNLNNETTSSTENDESLASAAATTTTTTTSTITPALVSTKILTAKTSNLEINNDLGKKAKAKNGVNGKANHHNTKEDEKVVEEEEEEEEKEPLEMDEVEAKPVKKTKNQKKTAPTKLAAASTTTSTASLLMVANGDNSSMPAAAAGANGNETMMTDLSSETNTTHHAVNVLPEIPCTSFCRNNKPGYVLAVGENLSNQLGMGADVDDKKKPQLAKELEVTNVIQIAAGGMHSACLTEDGVVYTFGCNDEFALGREDEEDVGAVNLPEKCIEVTAGDSHCAALSATGIVYAWGTFRDGSGVLGLEQKKIAKTPMQFKIREKIVKISSGADHLVFLTVTGEVYTAGNSEHGQLGRISKYNSSRGGRRGCDSILVPGLVRFGKRKELAGLKQIEDIWTSSYCTFLKLKDSNIIIGFGLNNCFQLGIEDMENRYQPDILQALLFEGTLKKVIGGMHHTLFLDSKGYVYSMGSHRYGGLGLGKLEADVKFPTRISDLKDIVDIAANTNVSYAIDNKGKCFSWGTNYSKQLGQDTEDDYFVPTLIRSKNMDSRDVYTVSVGGQHSLFVVSDEKDEDSDASIAT